MAAAREYDYAGVLDNFSNDYPINQTTFYTQLQKAGYYTMMTGKDDLNKATQLGYKLGKYLPNGAYHMKEMGISGGIRHSGKEDVIDVYPTAHEAYGFFLQNHTVTLENGTALSGWTAHYACFSQDRTLCDASSYPDDLYEDNFVAANAIALLDQKPKGVPWFLQVSFPGPHPPFLTTARMAQTTENRTWPQPTDSTVVDKCTNKAEPGLDDTRCNYAAELENLDRLFGLIVDKVQSLGELEDTLICISSDHGEMLGDHDGWGKTKPWEASIGVPLLFFGSPQFNIRPNVAINDPVATLDLAGTFLDYGGATPAPTMTTYSLRPFLEGTGRSKRAFVSSGFDNFRLVVQTINGTNFKFVCCRKACPNAPTTIPKPVGGWTQVLYDVDKDPFDMTDLSAQYPHVVSDLRAFLPSTFGCGTKYEDTEDLYGFM